MSFALAEQIPVVALDSWEFATGGKPDTGVHRASTPQEAVDMAIALAEQRGDA